MEEYCPVVFNCYLVSLCRYLDNRVFVSLANGDICVYLRDNGE